MKYSKKTISVFAFLALCLDKPQNVRHLTHPYFACSQSRSQCTTQTHRGMGRLLWGSVISRDMHNNWEDRWVHMVDLNTTPLIFDLLPVEAPQMS